MVKKGSEVPASVAAGVICLALGGAAGFLGRDAQVQSASASSRTANATMGKSSGGGGSGGMPGSGDGPGGAGGAAAPNPGRDLTRLVSSLNTVEKVQNKGLTADQKKQLLPLMEAIQKADTLPEAEATAKLDAVKKVLTADQQQTLADLTPQRGGRGGGGGAGGAGGGRPGGGGAPGGIGGSGGMGGSMGGGMGGSGGRMGGGMGGQQDPNKPFASERNKKALDDLIANLK